MEALCAKMPKIELHAHLAGSVPEEVVKRLLLLAEGGEEGRGHEQPSANSSAPPPSVLTNSADDIEDHLSLHGERRTMKECFEVFTCLHIAINNLTALETATRAVLETFAAENTVYLELRTTPRAFRGSSKADYLSTVLSTVNGWSGRTVVRLIVSVDRSKSLDEAKENVALALQTKQSHALGHLIAGVEVSGNPSRGELGPLVPLLQEASRGGLGVCLHACEVSGGALECLEVLQAVPIARIGHGTYMHCETSGDGTVKPDNRALVEYVKQHRIPIEVCVSSNLCTDTCAAVDQHHFGFWRAANHPVCVSTDDRGVFQTSLSKEFALFAKAFSLSSADLLSLTLDAASASLLPDEEKSALCEAVRKEWAGLQ